MGTLTRKDEESQLQTIIRASLDGFWITDLHGRFLDVNDAYCRLIGYSREELLTMGVIDVEAIESSADTARRIAELMERGSVHFETRHRHKDGTLRDIEVSANYTAFDGGRTYCFLRDITQRNLADIELRHYRDIVDSTDDAVIGKTLESMITSWNHGAERMFGYSATEAIGKSMQVLIPPDRAIEQAEILARIARGEHVAHFETVRRHKDGRMLDISATISPMLDATGTVVGASKLARDITERKQASERLRESEARVRTKLNAILSPEGDISMLHLQDIIDVPVIQSMMEAFSRAPASSVPFSTPPATC